MQEIWKGGLIATTVMLASSGQANALFEDGAYAEYQANLENGALVFNAAGCATCHGIEGEDLILAGGQALNTKFGELYAPNITADPDQGIGNWSNADFLNALLHGTAPDGRLYFGAVFPYPSYARMRPEDVLDLRGYIATLPSSDAASKPHNLSYMSQTILDFWSSSRGELAPMQDPQLARGQYLVEAVGHCAECHTPRDTGLGFRYEIDESKAFTGEVGLLGEYAPDISAERLQAFGPEAFVNGALAQAKKLNGNPMSKPSMRRMSRLLAQLPTSDRAAIYAYLTGTTLDVSTLPDLAVETVQVAASATPVQIVSASTATATAAAATPSLGTIPDTTGAPRLMARVDAFCEAQEAKPLTASATPLTPTGPDPKLEKETDQLVETYCRACHAPGKTYAAVFPTGDIADLKFDRKAVVPGNPDKSPLYESIKAARMPTGQKMSAEQLAVIGNWINALAEKPTAAVATTAVVPEPPRLSVPAPSFAGGSWNERMLAAVSDISAIEERDRPFIRYFSFAEMPLSKIDCSATDARRNPMHYMHAGFNKFVNSISRGPRVVPVTPVRGTEGALVRIDMRDFGWDNTHWQAISTGAYGPLAEAAGFDAGAWADLATAYPYAVDPSSDPLLKVVADATRTDVPIMRADWFTHFAAEAPYYDIFLGLTGQIRDLEMRLGIDVDREIMAGRMIRAAMLPGSSGVSDHNRMLERFDLPRGGYYWKSYDFAGDQGGQSLSLHPDGPFTMTQTRTGLEGFEHDGGEMIFSLPNGLQGYYLSTAHGDRLTVGPASIVSFRTKPIGKGVEIENARSCFDCHENGTIAKSDQMRELLENSARYSRDDLDMLLEMYIDNDRLDDLYRRDSAAFLNALSVLNATEISPTGELTSLSAPKDVGGGEIVTYLADMHFHTMTAAQLAREFQMEEETFRERARRLGGDPQLMLVVQDWLARADAGVKIHRSEMETVYPELLGRLSDLKAYRPTLDSYVPDNAATATASYEATVTAAIATKAEQPVDSYVPAETTPSSYTPPAAPAPDRLQLGLNVPKTVVYVNDLLEFDVTANKRCELQIFYVEESKNIEELPQAILGPQFLEAGETRRIPYAGSGLQIRFDEPGANETMFAFCREGGLGDQRMTAVAALDYAKSRYQPLTRGITIEAATRVEKDEGASAANHVTFNVLP